MSEAGVEVGNVACPGDVIERGVEEEGKEHGKVCGGEGWDAVLLSEVRADDVGVVWISQDAELTAIVHSRKTTILLQGELLKQWCEDGQ